MCIRKILYTGKYMLTKCVLLAVVACMQSITQAKAEICFLPSGECEHTIPIKTEDCKDWSASEREQTCSAKNGYVRGSEVAAKEGEGFSCSPVLKLNDGCCPGWYYCTEVSCQDQGYQLTGQLNPNDYICTPCTQGGDTYYKCEPKPCNYDPDNPTASTLADVCTNTNDRYCIDTTETNLCTTEIVDGVERAYTWTADPVKKAGKRACGKCVELENPPSPPVCTDGDCVQCKDDRYFWKENLPGGCVTCTVVGNVNGKDYYCCEDIEEYPVADCNEDTEGSCYGCEGPVRATGADDINCYKQVEKECGNPNQYIDRSVNGCYCRDYVYTLSATPTNLNYTAAGGAKTVAVTSTISTNSSTSNYPYEVETGKKGLCTVSDNRSGTVTVDCAINESTTPFTTSFKITQTPKKITNTHGVLYETISIKVEGDTCYEYQFDSTCSLDGWVAEQRRKSESGAADCYECVNDNCPNGYTKGNTPSPAEGYDTATTDHGSNCYKAKACQDGATTTNRNANGECYDCTAHGYAGSTPCWICNSMDTTCDTANGYVWSENSCGCIPAGCATGDVSKQSVEDCGSSGSAGWIYTYAGMSGGKKCGICTKKDCSGSTTDLSATNSYYSCTSCYDGDIKRYTCICNLTDSMCGSGMKADMSTCTCKNCNDSCASHQWTSNKNDCHNGYKTESSICNIQCYSCNACSDTCPVSGEKKSTSELSCAYGTEAGTATECGTTCYRCRKCPPGLYETKSECETASSGNCEEAGAAPGCWVKTSGSCDNKATISCKLTNPTGTTPCPSGTGIFTCTYSIPTCSFSSAQIWGYDGLSNDTNHQVQLRALSGSGSVSVYSCQLGSTCKFYGDGSTLLGTASLSGSNSGGFSCSYTR